MAQVQRLFVNLPVSDIAATRGFWTALGFGFNPRFSGDQSLALELGDNIGAMLLQRDFFRTFTDRGICDTTRELQCLLAIQFATREEVDAVVEAALAHGGREAHPPEDHGFMYQRAFHDPDGHGWGPFWMDLAGPPAQD